MQQDGCLRGQRPAEVRFTNTRLILDLRLPSGDQTDRYKNYDLYFGTRKAR